MKITNGSALIDTESSSSRTSAQARLLELLGLLMLGAVAVAVHAAGRRRFELGPGHQGLTWIALLMVGRLTSRQRWAGVTTAVGAAGATFLPIWRLGDPYLWLSYLVAGAIVDVGFVRAGRGRALWAIALLGGIAHAAKPLIRVAIQLGGWRYESHLAGVAFPLATHLMFGAGGALIAAGIIRASRRRSGG